MTRKQAFELYREHFANDDDCNEALDIMETEAAEAETDGEDHCCHELADERFIDFYN